jgi:uncharacterized membrane protein YgcG
MAQNKSQSMSQTITLHRELDAAKRELAKLRESVNRLKNEANGELPPPPPPPAKPAASTRYDFPAPTWIKETLAVLVCVVGHFIFGVTRVTTFEYIFIDIVGFVMCLIALVIGLNIKKLNEISFVQGSPSRIKADRLARIAGWIVAVAFIIGSIIIFYQSVSDMFAPSETSERVTYFLLYFAFLGAVWYAFFRPTNFDLYSFNASPAKRSDAFRKKMYKKDIWQWQSKVRAMGYTREDFDNLDSDYDWDDNDFDWDNDDSSDSDSDWGGGDSGGGGASSEW